MSRLLSRRYAHLGRAGSARSVRLDSAVRPDSSDASASQLRWPLVGLSMVLLMGCGSGAADDRSPDVPCKTAEQCPAGWTCGPSKFCQMPVGGVADAGRLDDGLTGDGAGAVDGSAQDGSAQDGSVQDGSVQDTVDKTSDTEAADGVASLRDVSADGAIGPDGLPSDGLNSDVLLGDGAGSDGAGNDGTAADGLGGDSTADGSGDATVDAGKSCAVDNECDDGLACTDDSCTKGICTYDLKPNICLIDDKCVNAGIYGPTDCLLCAPVLTTDKWSPDVDATCDDGVACTAKDACNKMGLCVGEPIADCCAKDADCGGKACSTGICDQGSKLCTYTAKKDCCKQDSDCAKATKVCTAAVCNALTQTCEIKASADGDACDDGEGCSINDTCASGACSGAPNLCDDQNPCTSDSCTNGACANTAIAGCSACWDPVNKAPKIKGTICGAKPHTTERRCLKGDVGVEERRRFATCTGLNVTCSTAEADLVWQPWKLVQKCKTDEKCIEKTKGEPQCISTVAKLADLTIKGFKATSSSYLAGGTVNTSGTLNNMGNTPSTVTSLEWRLSDNPAITPDDALLKSGSRAVLAAGGSISIAEALVLPKTLKPGTYYLAVTADSTKTQKESDEKNNTALFTITVKPPPLPDLYVQSFYATKSTYKPGEMIQVRGWAKNIGQGVAGTFTKHWQLSSDPYITSADPILSASNAVGLKPGVTMQIGATFGLPKSIKPGTYYLGMTLDQPNYVKETNELNNTRTFKIVVPAPGKADLRPINFSLQKTTLKPGDYVQAYGNAQNAGQTTSGGFSAQWLLSKDTNFNLGDMLLLAKNMPSLAAGGSTNLSVGFKVPSNTTPGTYYVGVWLDPGNTVQESNENNNVAYGKIIVAKLGKPDLIPLGFRPTKTIYAAGSVMQTSGVVRNSGTISAGSYKVEWRLSKDSNITTADTFLYTRTMPALSVNAQRNTASSFLVPANTVPGTYYIGIMVDSSNQVSESNEVNNRAATKITIQAPLPDLRVSSFKPSKTSFAPGEKVYLNTTVANSGKGSSTSSVVEWRLSTNSQINTADTLLRTTYLKALPAGSSAAVNSYFIVPSKTKPGKYYLGAWVDRANKVKESNEGNNIRLYYVTVVPPPSKPDLVVLNFKLVTTVIKRGNYAISSGVVKNQGKATAGTSAIEWRLSTNTFISKSDRLLSSAGVGSLKAGGSIPMSRYLKIPTNIKPGTYYLAMWVDSASNVSESNEGNNKALVKVTIQ